MGKQGAKGFERLGYDQDGKEGEGVSMLATPKASQTPLTQNATLAMML
jgi:hypothetical protein